MIYSKPCISELRISSFFVQLQATAGGDGGAITGVSCSGNGSCGPLGVSCDSSTSFHAKLIIDAVIEDTECASLSEDCIVTAIDTTGAGLSCTPVGFAQTNASDCEAGCHVTLLCDAGCGACVGVDLIDATVSCNGAVSDCSGVPQA